MNNKELADDHRRCAIATHNKVTGRRWESRTDRLIAMQEATYHATMAVFYQLKISNREAG